MPLTLQSARWKSYRPHVVSSRSWQSRRANKHNARDPPPKTRCLRLHPVPSPSQMASILLAHVSQGTRGKSLFLDPSYQTTLHTTLCCDPSAVPSAVYYLHSTIQEARLDHIERPCHPDPRIPRCPGTRPNGAWGGAREVVRRSGSAATEPTTPSKVQPQAQPTACRDWSCPVMSRRVQAPLLKWSNVAACP